MRGRDDVCVRRETEQGRGRERKREGGREIEREHINAYGSFLEISVMTILDIITPHAHHLATLV